jgi:hypothetical protein
MEAHPSRVDDVMAAFSRISYDHANKHGNVTLNKDDGIFRCRLPMNGRRSI